MSTLIDLPNNIYRLGGFDVDNGMALPFAIYTGNMSFPSRQTQSQTQAWNVNKVIASNIHSRAIISSAMGRMSADGYFTTDWQAIGGSGILAWIDNGPGGFDAKYQSWLSISGGNLTLWGRQYISNHSTVGSATLSYRIALLGFANTP